MNEIKKILYKENPSAIMIEKNAEGLKYKTTTSIGDIEFTIPIEECYYENKFIFDETMPAKELIRWINK
jgi:hypothetical protein